MATDTKPDYVYAAEVAKYEAEAAHALAQARLTNAQATEAERELEILEYRLRRAHEEEVVRINSDDHHHLYQFSADITAATVKTCMETLRRWHRLDDSAEIELIFNSPGGSVIAGYGLFDLLKGYSLRGGGKHKVTIGVLGYAASMAGVLLQVGDHRWMGAEAYILIHELSGGAGGKIGDIADTVKWFEKIEERTTRIFVERSGGKITKSKFQALQKRTDWWLTSDEALKFGFVDEVR